MHFIELHRGKSGKSLMVACPRLAGASVWRHRRRGAKRWDCLSDRGNGHWLDEWSCRRTYRRTIAAGSIPPSPIAVASAELSAGAQAVFLDQVTGAGQETCLYHVTTIQARCDYLAPVLRGILDFLLAPPVSFRDI